MCNEREITQESLFNYIGAKLLNYTADKLHVGYQMGARATTSGNIDCSGWVAETTLAIMQKVNDRYGPALYDIESASAMLKAAAAPQLERLSQKVGLIDLDAIHSGNLQSGTLIGIRRPDGGEWAAKRWNRISHIVIFVDTDHGRFVSQSADGYGLGVHLTPFDQWLGNEQRLQSGLFAANPYKMLAESVPPHVRQSLLEDEPKGYVRSVAGVKSVRSAMDHLPLG